MEENKVEIKPTEIKVEVKEETKEKADFFKRYSLYILIVVLLIAFIVRIYYFSLTKNQAVWWDEAEYLVQAKHIAFNLPNTGWFEFREPLMPVIFAFFYKLGLGEMFFRWMMIIMSLLGIGLVYKIGERFYNTKVAIIASLLMSIFYLDVFYSMRILLVVPSTLFSLGALYFFMKGYKGTKRPYLDMTLAAILTIAGMLIYYASVFIIFSYLVYLFLIERFRLFKNKRFLTFIILCLIIFLPYGIYSMSKYHAVLPRFSALGTSATGDTFTPGAWANYLKQFPFYLRTFFLIIFILYLIYFIFNFVIGYDLFFKQKDNSLNSDVFMFLWILIPVIFLSYVAVILSGHTEDRYLHSVFPAIFLMVGNGLYTIYNSLKKFNKQIIILAIIIILIIGMIPLVKYTNTIIKDRVSSYYGVKMGGLWIKENSKPGDVIISNSLPQNTYYSERATYYSADEEKIKSYKPKYLVWSVFESSGAPESDYVKYIQGHSKELKPVQAYFADKEQKQPILIIYEANFS